ncbi:hypothetical protein LEP1GSC037_4466 [Leptospira interrogans str. 2006001854]|uniref:Uncharacterized protein n=2 Tax=Leptospira interrogans TaxID=173 RepID=M6HHF3_LEPIR|nr:hypothetical protein LEP1GSC037_4466 [Leptospira interrogans str. 2006001854]EMM96758.1 hypothetical protein LEP1GSC158_1454 [Leptospira interrogans serovar Zanoni str. LT2156]
MAIYSYVAFNKKGKEEKGIIDAASLQAARSKLKTKVFMFVVFPKIPKERIGNYFLF